MKNGANEAGDQSQNGNLSQNETASLKLTQLSQIETASQIETGGNVAGGEVSGLPIRTGATLPNVERIAHSKALRTTAGKFPGVNLWAIEYLAALKTYLILRGREGIGVSEPEFLDWTGARARWQKRMEEGRIELEAAGAVEWVEVREMGRKLGRIVDITEHGERILRAYNDRFAEVMEDIEARRAVSALNMATRRLSLERRRLEAEARKAIG